MKRTCWFCYPDLTTGCIRPSNQLLCDEHREAERARLQALKDKYAHLTLDEQTALWRREQRDKRRAGPSYSAPGEGETG